MMNQEGYGYYLYPPRRHSEPGGSGLEVLIQERPSKHHFDPESVLLTIVDTLAGVMLTSIKHPWNGASLLIACAGPINLIDRKGTQLECFSYGGQLQIEVKETSTRLILNSPAPILIRPAHALANMLAEETEILLAERRAATPDPDIFEKHLAAADPLALYQACLETLSEQLHHLPSEDNEQTFKYKHMLSSERKAIEQISKDSFKPRLEQIL